MPRSGDLEGVSRTEDRLLVEPLGHDLQPDRQSSLAEPGGHRDGREPRVVRRSRIRELAHLLDRLLLGARRTLRVLDPRRRRWVRGRDQDVEPLRRAQDLRPQEAAELQRPLVERRRDQAREHRVQPHAGVVVGRGLGEVAPVERRPRRTQGSVDEAALRHQRDRDLFDRGAEALEHLRRLEDPGLHLWVEVCRVDRLLHEADPESAHLAVEDGRVVGHREPGRHRVERVVPGDGVQDQRAVRDGPRERGRGVLVPARGDEAVRAHPAP